MIADSNLFIYVTQPDYGYLIDWFKQNTPLASAIESRRQRKMSLGDALIAATALEHRLILATRNVKDFEWITGLKIVNPIREMF